MSLFESVFGKEKVVEVGGLEGQVLEDRTATDETKPEDPVVLGLPLVTVEASLNEDGFRADAPISYGTNHVGSGRITPDDESAHAGDGPGALHLNLPPLSASAGAPAVDPNQPPNGSIDGPLDDLYITKGRGTMGTESPNHFQQRLRAEELGEVYRGTSDELQLPLPSAKEMNHLRGRDTGVTHSA
ncbi:MAG: hypothetical protein WBP40_01030 [Candidatus Moraniibacteriota bacterium]